MSDMLDINKVVLVTDRSILGKQVYDQIGNPVNVWAVAATIESLGIRDIDAFEDFGFESVFTLAEQVFVDLKEHVKAGDAESRNDLQNLRGFSGFQQFRLFAKYYGRGLLFSLPMLSQFAAILIFGYSLWAWLQFNEAQATLVAMGTIIAFIVTGGFIQVLGRSVSKYSGENNYLLVYHTVQKTVVVAIAAIVIIALILWVLNMLIPFYPNQMMLLGLVYYLLISLFLLASGVLYALEQRFFILLYVVAGTAVVIAGMNYLNWGIYLSHWAGLGLTLALITLHGYRWLQKKVDKTSPEMLNQKLPQTGVQWYLNYRHFVYGVIYFAFLFLDRLLAWSAGPPPTPYLIWFNTPYELGMDWALLSLVITIPVLEYSVQTFSRLLTKLQGQGLFSRIDEFNRYFRRSYRRQLTLLFITGLISIAVSFFAVDSLRVLQNETPVIRDFFADPMTTRVFWIAGFGYLFLAIGLFHCLFFFTLNRVDFALYSIAGAFVLNFVSGFICSRVFGLEFASVGLLVGAIGFALISGWLARRFFRELDYYYYAAF